MTSASISSRFRIFVALAVLVLLAVALRLPGLTWLLSVAPSPDFSFMTDDQRFVELAKDFRAGTLDGYVYGMSTHALTLASLLAPLFPDLNMLQMLRVVTLLAAALTVLFTYLLARDFGLRRPPSLLAGFLIATAPTHVATSNYGTADVTAVAYFCATLLCAGRYLRTREQLYFVAVAIMTGAAIAVKLFLPLLIPLALLMLTHRRGELVTQGLTGFFISLGAFEFASFCAYTPWDLALLSETLRKEVVTITGGNGPIRQMALYAWDLPGAIGLPAFLLLAMFAGAYASTMLAATRAWLAPALRAPRQLITPLSVLIATLLAHLLLLAFAGVHAVRHLLVLLPPLCIAAAAAAHWLANRFARQRWAPTAIAGMLIAYGVTNAASVELLYLRDLRLQVGQWAQETIARGARAITFSEWSHVKGTTLERHTSPALLRPNDQVVTCDLDYQKFIRDRSATNLYMVDGGQARTDFYWNVFEGKGVWRIAHIYRARPMSVEQWLIDRQLLRPIGTFIPKTCIVLARTSKADVVNPATLLPKVYNYAGW